jgi:hypothetical protein
MSVLLLVTPKVLLTTPPAEWARSVGPGAVLFTGGDTPEQQERLRRHAVDAFEEVHCFARYEHNDLVERRAVQLHARRPFRNVVCLAEVDVLRGARIRERCGIPGHAERDALYFRDKLAMKRRARERGLGTPRFARVEHAFDLLEFVEANGLPVIVRPTTGRGSADTVVIRSDEDIDRYLASCAIAATDFVPSLFVETFVDGPMFRVDGLMVDGAPKAMQIGAYLNTTLDFMAGGVVGTHSLDRDNPLRGRIEGFVRHLLTRTLPSAPCMLFHVQLFEGRDGELVLCEVASRIGGGAINDEARIATGIDLKMEFVRHMCLPGYRSPAIEEGRLADEPVGRVLIPPRKGVLEALPQDCPLPWVRHYTAYGVPGRRYDGPAMTNAEVASFVYTGASEAELLERASALAAWFEERARWAA